VSKHKCTYVGLVW